MAEILPINIDLPPHYSGDGLKPFTIQLSDYSGITSIVMDLVNSLGVIGYRFSTLLTGENGITITDGLLTFPEIKAWDLKSSVYNYEIKSIDSTGFVRTHQIGKWAIAPNINAGSGEYIIPELPIESDHPTSSEDTFIII